MNEPAQNLHCGGFPQFREHSCQAGQTGWPLGAPRPSAAQRVTAPQLSRLGGPGWPLSLPGTPGATIGEGTYTAWVALQELDLLKELDVVCTQAVQLALQGLDGVLGQAVLLVGGGGGSGQVGRQARPTVERVVGRGCQTGAGPARLPGAPSWPVAISLTF